MESIASRHSLTTFINLIMRHYFKGYIILTTSCATLVISMNTPIHQQDMPNLSYEKTSISSPITHLKPASDEKKVFLLSSIFYLFMQELLNIYSFFYLYHHSDSIHFSSLFCPAAAFIIIYFIYLLFKSYNPRYSALYLIALSELFLFGFQLIPLLFKTTSIVYVCWSFIMSTTAAGCVGFSYYAFHEVHYINLKSIMFRYNELKFFLDKISILWMTLGSILAVCMTILWTAPLHSFNMNFNDRTFWSTYMVFSFFCVSVLTAIFVAIPIASEMKTLKTLFLHFCQKDSMPQLESS